MAGTLAAALEQLFPNRGVRDARPWAIGFLGYEEAALLAGGLPIGDGWRNDHAPRGWWLLEPDRVARAPVRRGGGRASPIRPVYRPFGPSLDQESYRGGWNGSGRRSRPVRSTR